MSDRLITWKEAPEWGAPTPEKLAAVAIDFLGDRWKTQIEPFPSGNGAWVYIYCEDKCTFHLSSERPEMGDPFAHPDGDQTRGFQIYFPFERGKTTSVITKLTDSFTSALAKRYTEIIAKWWNGEVEWPT